MRRLVESWIEAEREHYGNNLAAAIQSLNDELGTHLRISRVAEWRRGRYVPAPKVLSYMLNRTLGWALRQAGICVSPEQRQVLDGALWVTYEKDGEPWFDLV